MDEHELLTQKGSIQLVEASRGNLGGMHTQRPQTSSVPQR